MAESETRGNRRGGAAAGMSARVDVTERGDLLVAQGLPQYAEMSRLGNGWTVSLASGVAPLVAVPTTTAALEVYNNGSRTAFVRDLYLFRLLGTAAAQTVSLWAMVTTKKAVPTLSALVLYSLSGKEFITPTAAGEIVTGVGTTVVANGWRPYGPPLEYVTEAAVPNKAFSVEINGRLIIPPGCSLCLHAVGATTAGTVTLGLSYDLVGVTVES